MNGIYPLSAALSNVCHLRWRQTPCWSARASAAPWWSPRASATCCTSATRRDAAAGSEPPATSSSASPRVMSRPRLIVHLTRAVGFGCSNAFAFAKSSRLLRLFMQVSAAAQAGREQLTCLPLCARNNRMVPVRKGAALCTVRYPQARPRIFDLEIQVPDVLYERVVEVNEEVVLPLGDEPDRCEMFAA